MSLARQSKTSNLPSGTGLVSTTGRASRAGRPSFYSPMNPFKQALANRIVQFSKRQERRNLSTDAVEEIINTMHSSPYKFGKTWRQHEQNCEAAGLKKAKRRQERQASFQSEFLHKTDAIIHRFKDGTIDAAIAPPAPESPRLTKRQVKHAITTIKRTGALPPSLEKKLKQQGKTDSQIHNLCQQIINK